MFHLPQKMELGDGIYVTSEFPTYQLQSNISKDGHLYVELLVLSLVPEYQSTW